MNATKQVFQSKWGFHTCSRETSKKLRFLNMVYQKALHIQAAWVRWDAKAPHNRVHRPKLRRDGQVIGYGDPVPWNEPGLCPIFQKKITKKVQWHPKVPGYHKEGIDYTYLEINDRGKAILEASRLARTPVPTLEEVKPLRFITEKMIDEWYDEAVQWLATRK